jgi:hypothetical protein
VPVDQALSDLVNDGSGTSFFHGRQCYPRKLHDRRAARESLVANPRTEKVSLTVRLCEAGVELETVLSETLPVVMQVVGTTTVLIQSSCDDVCS